MYVLCLFKSGDYFARLDNIQVLACFLRKSVINDVLRLRCMWVNEGLCLKLMMIDHSDQFSRQDYTEMQGYLFETETPYSCFYIPCVLFLCMCMCMVVDLLQAGNIIDSLKTQTQERQKMIDKERSKSRDTLFYFNILQMELDRINFMISSYLRIRLRKIEKFSIYMLRHENLLSLVSGRCVYVCVSRRNHLSLFHFWTRCLKCIPDKFISTNPPQENREI